MSFDVLPITLPVLPEGIDVVWVATAYETPTLWRLDRWGWCVADPGTPPSF